jgi:mRNA export factor
LPDDFCFKSHREETTPGAKLYSVNGLSFNKQFGTFASYGQDGCYFFWNKDTKSKLKSTKPAPWPITAGDYLENAQLFAFAFGYDWGKGAEEVKKTQFPVKLFVRKVKDEEAFKKPAAK